MVDKNNIINMFDMFPDQKNHQNPLVFQCSKCMTIIGDSLSWQFSSEAQQMICLSRVTESISIDRDVHLSQTSTQQMSTYSKLFCRGCWSCIGRMYHSTSLDFDPFRGLYTLDVKRISCYKTGGDSNEGIFSSMESVDPIKYILVSMDERLRAVEKQLGMTRGVVGGNVDISAEDDNSNDDNNANSLSDSTLRHADDYHKELSNASLTTTSYVSN